MRRHVLVLVAQRLLILPVLLVLISIGVFSLVYLAPGSVEQALVGARSVTPALLAQIRREYHLNDPFFVQYWLWAKNAVRLNFGSSIQLDEPVWTVIKQNMVPTLYLGLYGFAIAVVCGVPLGAIAAFRRRSGVDRGIVGLSVIGVSAPAFATGLLLLYFFSIFLVWFPVYGEGRGFTGRLWHLGLPAAALALTAMALVVKLTRAGMISALEQDYVAFARARGVPARDIFLKYALRNALIPVVTSAGLILGYMLTGAVLVEVTFALPGIGSTLVDAVNFKDAPLVQGIAMVLATVIVLVNLMTDIAYLIVDPRVRFEGVSD
jgi:peptide/nickel transport system permease protein